ncbi:hypothetical protein [Methanoregula sp. UBA64]|uniref:hypothetical protein n=1 Tax=Methanoregula sp. UBA64 TaxID=1915554 RepID=UPI0025F86F3D|nr:hypothetical protein [Methanoregula sp. UBA64]
MFHEDNRVTRLSECGEELLGSECPAGVEVRGLTGNTREYPGVVARHIEEEEALKIRIAIEGIDHYFLGHDHGIEGSGHEGKSLAEFDLHRPGTLMH